MKVHSIKGTENSAAVRQIISCSHYSELFIGLYFWLNCNGFKIFALDEFGCIHFYAYIKSHKRSVTFTEAH